MRFLVVPLLLAALCSGTASAQEAVLRVVDLKAHSGATASLFHRKATDKNFYNAYVGTTGIVSDRFKTSPETIAALEFFIGGRVGINKDTEVEVTSERSVTDRGPLRNASSCTQVRSG